MPTYEVILLFRQLSRVSMDSKTAKSFILLHNSDDFLNISKITISNLTSTLCLYILQPQFKAAVRRAADQIFDRGGFIRKIDYLGQNKLPYKISKNQQPYREAEHLIFKTDVSAQVKDDMKEEINLDIDVIRCNIYAVEESKEFQCTLEDELKPVSDREDVKELLRLQEKGKKKKWMPQMGIEYYPFQR